MILRLISGFILGPVVIAFILIGGYYFNLVLFLVFLFFILEIKNLKKNSLKFVILLILILFVFCSYDIAHSLNGNFIVLYLMILSWSSDIGGYIFGKIIGGKKINIISPNKTFSGFFGSIIFAQLFALLINSMNMQNLLNELILKPYFVFFCTIVIIVGDLAFSYIKRLSNIKDFSNIIPGHGGLFDRIDGLIFLVIFVFISNL